MGVTMTSTDATDSQENQRVLIQALTNPDCYPHPAEGVTVLQTHISWILLAGSFAYKIKKAVNFGFLDFSTLKERAYYCQEEVRLNRRFSSRLYLGVVGIGGSLQYPRMGNVTGGVQEYAVKMHRFPEGQLLSDYAERGQLSTDLITAVARKLAAFHQRLPIDTKQAEQFGSDAGVHEAVLGNFIAIDRLAELRAEEKEIRVQLQRWTEEQLQSLVGVRAGRLKQGFIRECHGDLHASNIVVLDGEPVFFDCIEFNPSFRWIDVLSELAFLLMDLDCRGYEEHGNLLLNRYLEATGDFMNLDLVRFYKVYRAMVRAKVMRLRLEQVDQEPRLRGEVEADYQRYLNLAQGESRLRQPYLIITYGLSGPGKSFLARNLAPRINAVHIQSDVERKRLVGLAWAERSQSQPGSGIYTRSHSKKTYDDLLAKTEAIVKSGFPVIVDATFLERERRDRFCRLARALEVPFCILACQARDDVVRQRLWDRRTEANNASEADAMVMELQKAQYQFLEKDELDFVVVADTEQNDIGEDLARYFQSVLAKIPEKDV